MEHELDHKPCEVHMALSVAYNWRRRPARRARRAHAAPPAARSPLRAHDAELAGARRAVSSQERSAVAAGVKCIAC